MEDFVVLWICEVDDDEVTLLKHDHGYGILEI